MAVIVNFMHYPLVILGVRSFQAFLEFIIFTSNYNRFYLRERTAIWLAWLRATYCWWSALQHRIWGVNMRVLLASMETWQLTRSKKDYFGICGIWSDIWHIRVHFMNSEIKLINCAYCPGILIFWKGVFSRLLNNYISNPIWNSKWYHNSLIRS